MSQLGNIYDILGVIGGSILSLSLLPQIIKVIRTKSAKDLSYGWQFVALTGLILLAIYGFGRNLWPIYTTISVELALLITLMISKLICDHCLHKQSENNNTENTTV